MSSLLYFLHDSTACASLLSSHIAYSFTSLLSSQLDCLRFSTVVTSLLSSQTYFLDISTVFTFFLSSHRYILHVSSVFMSLLASHLSCLRFSIFWTSLLFSHFFFTSFLSSHSYFIHISIVLTSSLSSQGYFLRFLPFYKSLLPSFIYTLHFSRSLSLSLFKFLLSLHLWFLPIPTVFTSLSASLKTGTTEFRLPNFLWQSFPWLERPVMYKKTKPKNTNLTAEITMTNLDRRGTH